MAVRIIDELMMIINTNQLPSMQCCQKSMPKNPAFGFCQSPIDICVHEQADNNNSMHGHRAELSSFQLRFCYPSKVRNCTIINTGRTVQINVGKQDRCTLTVRDQTYTLQQFHFHTPAEHTLNGHQSEMEMHLVHSDEHGALAVLGLIFSHSERYTRPKLQLSTSRAHLLLTPHEQHSTLSLPPTIAETGETDDGDDDAECGTDSEWESPDDHGDDKQLRAGQRTTPKKQKQKQNDFLAQFFEELPAQKTLHEIALSKPISFDYLFETACEEFKKSVVSNEIDADMQLFEYIGSLTTPPYTEGVQWLVSKRKHFISSEQLHQLSACWRHENNARPTQQQFGRTISLRSNSTLSLNPQ